MPSRGAARTLTGKIALLTDAERGLGLAIAGRLASLGAQLPSPKMRIET
jgi:NADP-dependent 3-hydroxy acid dehydrogenase YdfG